jgi:hypothetical protein
MTNDLSRAVRRGMVGLAVANVALVVYGVIRFPTTLTVPRDAPLAICAGIGIATIYGLIGWFGVRAPGLRDPQVLRAGVRFGLCAGVLFAFSMLGEYLVPHDHRQNVLLALATFGFFFLLMFAAGFFATLATRRLLSGPLAACWCALIGSQLWFFLLLSIYYAFVSTPQEARFLVVDQVIADFQRSGMRDLRAFIFEDYMGGGFYHSLLGPLLSLPLGLFGGLTAKAFQVIRKTTRSEFSKTARTSPAP